MIDKEFLIWFAGFWEGEGHFLVYSNVPPYYRKAVFGVSQAGERGRKIMEEIQRQIKEGHVYADVKRKTTMYEWVLYDAFKIKELVQMLLPHLRVRKEEVEQKLRILEENIRRRRYGWSEKEDRILIENANLPAKELAKLLLGFSVSSIYSRRRHIGLAKYRSEASRARYLKYLHCHRVRVEI